MFRLLAACLGAAMIGACTGVPTMSTDDELKHAEHLFARAEPAQIIAAARRALGDGATEARDGGFSHTVAWRGHWLGVPVDGADLWSVEAFDTARGAVATVSVFTRGEGSVEAGEAAWLPVKNDRLFELFWARTEYFLGLQHEFIQCSDWIGIGPVHPLRDGMAPLCRAEYRGCSLTSCPAPRQRDRLQRRHR